MDRTSIAIIGCGNMGGSIAKALSESNSFAVSVFDSDKAKAEKFASENNASVLSSISDATAMDVVLIAVKPQILPSISEDLKNLKPGLFISIAAGFDIATLEKMLEGKVARYMPNLAARTKKAVTAVAFSLSMENSDKKLAMDIANSFGSAFELEEKLFSAFIGISGSAIAYVFEMIHQIAMGGVREGIAYPKSLEIVRNTFESATSLLKESGLGAVELETMVCSAGGTTIEGVKALEDGNLGATLINAVSAAAEKSRKMEAKGR